MANTDTIADMLTRIRNAVNATHETVNIPSSKLKVKLAEVLKKEGYITSYEVIDNKPGKTLKITLKYGPRGEKLITGLQKVSTVGVRRYTKSDVPRVFDGLGICIVSTNKGLKTDRESRKEKIGGEILCKVW